MKKKNLLIVVAIMAAGAIAAYLLLQKEPDYNKIASDYFAPYPNELAMSSRSDEADSTDDPNLGKLMAMYEAKRYDEALTGFNAYLEEKPDRYELKFYRGIINLKNEKSALAVADFMDVLKNGRSFKDQSEWYLGLAYLKNNQKKEAADLFNKIAASNSAYNEKADEILNKIPYKPLLKKEIENM